MATRSQKPKSAPAKKPAAKKPAPRRKPAAKSDLDRRWSILLFGLGLFFVLLAVVPGESGWAWLRLNILFGAFGISGWLLGPMLVYWAVLISLEKPVLPAIIKGILFLLALCGAALVFGNVDLKGLGFGEVLAALHESGRSGAFGGGVLSLLFGASLLALCGQLVARILLVLLVLVATMVLTSVTPGDIVRFFRRIGDSLAERFSDEEEYEEELQQLHMDEDQPAVLPAVGPMVAVPPTAKTNHKMAAVDIALEATAVPPVARSNRRMTQVDIPLDPVVPPPVEVDMFRDRRVDVDLGPDPQRSEPGPMPGVPVDLGPGGTFGKKALDEAQEYGLGDYEPLVPFGKRPPLVDATASQQQAAPDGDVLLFGEDDPYANLGGQGSQLPKGALLDVEYIPMPDAGFDLFGNPASGGAADAAAVGERMDEAPDLFAPEAGPDLPPVVAAAKNAAEAAFEMPEPQAEYGAPVATATPEVEQTGMAEPSASAAGGPSVDEMIEKAAAVKDDRATPGADTRGQDDFAQPYQYPPLNLFDTPPKENIGGVREEMKRTADLLVSTLASFGVDTRILDVFRGPSVTRYEIQPQAGVKISRITNLADDIALNLAAAGVRIEAPIPGKPAVGIEVPNKVKSVVPIRGILESSAFADATSPLAIALGKDIAGDVVVADLTKMPHLLIAGSTGSGKSVCVNSIIMSILFKSSPEEVRMVLIDPKVVELAEYNGIPHLLIPVVTEPKKAAQALGQAVKQMEDRYHLFAEHGVRDISSYNKMAKRTGKVETIPHIAIIIDELADLMMTAGKDVENYICRIAQKARAAGMHLIVATQRPSVDVITGLIKSNIPSRIAFAVSSQVDSRTILDGGGAEKLLGMGDMLFMPIGANKPVRVQGTFVKDREISQVLRFVKNNGTALYDDEYLAEMDKVQLSGAAGAADMDGDEDSGDVVKDPTFAAAVEMALDAGEISTSGLQRRLRLGYARAGRIVDQMERLGIVSEPNGSKPRQTLITRQMWQEMVMNASG